MNALHSGTYQYLLQQYGPLLTLKQIAELLHSTPNGVRMAISRGNQTFAVGLSKTRRHFGRRVYFEARRVAELIDRDAEANDNTVDQDAKKEIAESDGRKPVLRDKGFPFRVK